MTRARLRKLRPLLIDYRYRPDGSAYLVARNPNRRVFGWLAGGSLSWS